MKNSMKKEKICLIRLPLGCNFNCLFCFLKKKESYPSDFSVEDILRQIDNAKRTQSNKVTFSGGEPTLVKELPFLINQAKEEGIEEVELQTNALKCAYEGYVKEIKNAGLDSVLIGFHSHKEGKFNSLTRTKGYFPKVIEGINNLFKYKIAVSFNHTITALTYPDLEEYVKFLIKNFPKPRSVLLTLVYPCGQCWKYKKIIPRAGQVAPYFLKAKHYCQEKGVKVVTPHCGMPGFPLCLLDNGRENNLESLVSFGRKGVRTEEFDFVNLKPKSCQICKYNKICEGIALNYKKLYGTSEFKPVRTVSVLKREGSRFFILSSNCPTATVECFKLEGKLVGLGFQKVNLPLASAEDAKLSEVRLHQDNILRSDFCIIGGCGAVKYCEDQTTKLIEQIAKINPQIKILVGGCWAKYKRLLLDKNKIKRVLPNEKGKLKLFEGYQQILNFVSQKYKTKKSPQKELGLDLNKDFRLRLADNLNPNNPSESVLIKSGCDNFCTYCIIASMCPGGTPKYYPSKEILRAVKEKEKMDCRKIRFVGACISDWKDPQGSLDLADLIKLVLDKTKVNFGEFELHPKDINDKLLSTLGNPRITKLIKVPIQHYSDRILKRMNRKYDSRYLDILFDKLKRKKFLVSTDVIIGFPGENQSDVTKLIGFLKRFPLWSSISIFKYSPRLGTPAFSFKPRVNKKTKEKTYLRIVKELVGEIPSGKTKKIYAHQGNQISFFDWGPRIDFQRLFNYLDKEEKYE